MNIRILNYELREIDPKKWELYELKELDVKKSHRMAHMKGSGLRVEQGTKAWKPTGHYFQSLTPALVFIYHRELRNMGGGVRSTRSNRRSAKVRRKIRECCQGLQPTDQITKYLYFKRVSRES